jgi:cell division protein FtsI/penicillin-binding protein 2
MYMMRLLLVIGLLFSAYALLGWRAFFLGVIKHEWAVERSTSSMLDTETLPAQRGTIVDRNDRLLASSTPVRTISVNGTRVRNPAALADLLAGPLRLDRGELEKKIAWAQSEALLYKVLKARISQVEAIDYDSAVRNERDRLKENIENLRKDLKKVPVRGKENPEYVKLENAIRQAAAELYQLNSSLINETEWERFYPNDKTLGQVLGFVSGVRENAKGGAGIEQSFEMELCGTPGTRYVIKDALGNILAEADPLRHPARVPQSGKTVQLAIDLAMQQIVEEELDQIVTDHAPKGATIIVQRPTTGEILAMGSRPSFNPNNRAEIAKLGQNPAISSVYEPGSTFKLVTVTTAVNLGKVEMDDKIPCENGLWVANGIKLKDHHPYGDLSVRDIVIKSSNIGTAKLAKQLGPEGLHAAITRFGYGSPTQIMLPAESKGRVERAESWQPISMTRIPMGHEVSVTPLQVVCAYSALANGGVLNVPQIARAVRSADGKQITPYPPTKRSEICTPETASRITEALGAVTEKGGTGKLAAVEGYRVAGKTGTTQKLIGGKYSEKDHICSFVGFVPMEKPAFTILVIVDDSEVKNWGEDTGGLVAAPYFSAVAKRLLAYEGIAPDPELLQKVEAPKPAAGQGTRGKNRGGKR